MPGVEWWPIFWLFVALKIPLLAALWIIWWALRAEPEEADEVRAGGEHGGGPHRPRPRLPRAPRRGRHEAPDPASPVRVRVRSRERTPSRR